MLAPILKMKSKIKEVVEYTLPFGSELIPMNPLVGQSIHLRWTGQIKCVSCGNKTNKSFDQGHCWNCFNTLAACDNCIKKPEICHFVAGTCREPEWAQSHCFVPHIVYLSNSSGLKIGITRQSQVLTRWVDQGAAQAIVLGIVPNRFHSGLVESHFRDQLGLKDRTAWQTMLKSEPELLDLLEIQSKAVLNWPESVPMSPAQDNLLKHIKYPILEYPKKVSSLNLDKDPNIQGKLMGIKGQYLMLDSGVINLRKYQGYEFEIIQLS